MPSQIAYSIEADASLSGAIAILGAAPMAIVMPSAWTAADLTFQVSHDGTNYYNLYYGGSEERILSPTAGTAVALDPGVFACWQYMKVRSGTSGTAVNQAAARSGYIICGDQN